MKKRKWFYSIPIFICVGILNIFTISCENDDDSSKEKDVTFPSKVFFRQTGNFKTTIFTPNYVGGEHTGHFETDTTYIYTPFTVLEFNTDHKLQVFTAEREGETSISEYAGWFYDESKVRSLTYNIDIRNECVILSDGVTYYFEKDSNNKVIALLDAQRNRCFVIWDINDDLEE